MGLKGGTSCSFSSASAIFADGEVTCPAAYEFPKVFFVAVKFLDFSSAS